MSCVAIEVFKDPCITIEVSDDPCWDIKVFSDDEIERINEDDSEDGGNNDYNEPIEDTPPPAFFSPVDPAVDESQEPGEGTDPGDWVFILKGLTRTGGINNYLYEFGLAVYTGSDLGYVDHNEVRGRIINSFLGHCTAITAGVFHINNTNLSGNVVPFVENGQHSFYMYNGGHRYRYDLAANTYELEESAVNSHYARNTVAGENIYYYDSGSSTMEGTDLVAPAGVGYDGRDLVELVPYYESKIKDLVAPDTHCSWMLDTIPGNYPLSCITGDPADEELIDNKLDGVERIKDQAIDSFGSPILGGATVYHRGLNTVFSPYSCYVVGHYGSFLVSNKGVMLNPIQKDVLLKSEGASSDSFFEKVWVTEHPADDILIFNSDSVTPYSEFKETLFNSYFILCGIDGHRDADRKRVVVSRVTGKWGEVHTNAVLYNKQIIEPNAEPGGEVTGYDVTPAIDFCTS